MVRLRAGEDVPIPALSVEFQFQYGAIKSLNKLTHQNLKEVSIPIWCD